MDIAQARQAVAAAELRKTRALEACAAADKELLEAVNEYVRARRTHAEALTQRK